MALGQLGEGPGRTPGQVQHRRADQVHPARLDTGVHGVESRGELDRQAGTANGLQ
ncbi:hypothetical protein [Streptomyces axinellae]|uniref:hypothetical protein n=1 Tax=Streptomyces axinellae TaxID=552788 RepID=UPI0031D3C2DF